MASGPRVTRILGDVLDGFFDLGSSQGAEAPAGQGRKLFAPQLSPCRAGQLDPVGMNWVRKRSTSRELAGRSESEVRHDAFREIPVEASFIPEQGSLSSISSKNNCFKASNAV